MILYRQTLVKGKLIARTAPGDASFLECGDWSPLLIYDGRYWTRRGSQSLFGQCLTQPGQIPKMLLVVFVNHVDELANRNGPGVFECARAL